MTLTNAQREGAAALFVGPAPMPTKWPRRSLGWEAAGELLDPHTAIGLHAARNAGIARAPVVTLATAHPAKFPEAVERAPATAPACPNAWAICSSVKSAMPNCPAI
jgi:threonine synthase